jgi:hypothetical protein
VWAGYQVHATAEQAFLYSRVNTHVKNLLQDRPERLLAVWAVNRLLHWSYHQVSFQKTACAALVQLAAMDNPVDSVSLFLGD